MKKLILVCSILLLTFACKKDDGSGDVYNKVRDVISAHNWKIDDLALVAPVPTKDFVILGVRSVNQQIPICLKSNQYQFRDDDKVNVITGEGSCEGAPTEGEWRLGPFADVLRVEMNDTVNTFVPIRIQKDTMEFFQDKNDKLGDVGLYIRFVTSK